MGGGRGIGGKGGGHGGGKGEGSWGASNANIARMLQSLQQQNARQQQLLQALGDGTVLAGTAGVRAHRGETVGSGGGSSTKGGGRRGAFRGNWGGNDARPGDWTCRHCGAFPCFARASHCFRCRAPRRGGPAADGQRAAGGGGRLTAATGGEVYLGPLGANGNRPLLGGRGNGIASADKCPTQRVPGASQAAKAEEERQRRNPEDTLQARAGRPTAAAAAAAAPPVASPPRRTAPAPIATRNSWAALTEEEQGQESDGDMDIERHDEEDDEGDEGHEDFDDGMGNGRTDGDDGEEEEPTEAELKQRWIAHCAVVRRLERDGQPLPPGMLATVKAQRDAAERRWKAAKTPHPLHKRLRWAEADVRAAESKERTRRQELEDHLLQVDLRTKEIKARLEVDEARTARKRAALAELQREAGMGGRSSIEKAARDAVTGIGSDIAPAPSAIIERLGESDEGLRCDLQLLSTSLGKVEHVLRQAAEEELKADAQEQHQGSPQTRHQHRQQPARFDISDSSTAGGGRDNSDTRKADGGGACKHRRLDESADDVAGAATRWTKPAANAPWRKNVSSTEAVADARKMLQEKCLTDGTGGGGGTSSAETNDLALAERRAEEESLRQQSEALQRQRQLSEDPTQWQAEEEQRRKREEQRQEELRRHQNAIASAAAEAAAEEARKKAEVWANMSPEERAMATKALEQQLAVGAHVFGTTTASHAAGLVHQTHVHEVAQVHQANQEAEIQMLMAMSPEEFSRWDQERQSLV